MLRHNKDRYSPDIWGYGLIQYGPDEAELRDQSTVLLDRYGRGLILWKCLLDNPWYGWRRDKFLVGQLESLRGEYRELLDALIEGQKRARVRPGPVWQTCKCGAVGTLFRNGECSRCSFEYPEKNPFANTEKNPFALQPLAVSSSIPRNTAGHVHTRGIEIYMPGRDEEPEKTIFVPFDPPTSVGDFTSTSEPTYEGGGGSFGGAGATVDWGAPDTSSSTDCSSSSTDSYSDTSSCDTSSSTDFGSHD